MNPQAMSVSLLLRLGPEEQSVSGVTEEARWEWQGYGRGAWEKARWRVLRSWKVFVALHSHGGLHAFRSSALIHSQPTMIKSSSEERRRRRRKKSDTKSLLLLFYFFIIRSLLKNLPFFSKFSIYPCSLKSLLISKSKFKGSQKSPFLSVNNGFIYKRPFLQVAI